MKARDPNGRKFTAQFENALVYATRLHADQVRKNSQIPYIAHLLGVSALVLEDGGDEEEAIAALLHDAVEDQGGLETLDQIRTRFGSRVATIVLALSDSIQEPKPPWRKRKEQFIESLSTAEPSAIRVSLADKVHNARSTLRDIRLEGVAAWSRFKGGKEGTLWYYKQLIQVFQKRSGSTLVEELDTIIRNLEKVSGGE